MQNSKDSTTSRLEKYTELSKSSLVRIQYSCCGNNSQIDEGEYIPIVSEMAEKAAQLTYGIANGDFRLAIIDLLSKNNLPIKDLETGERTFLIAQHDNELIACVAVEKYRNVGLLRSLAVKTDWKGNGIGTKLAELAEKWSTENDIKQLYLLTTTATEFFQGLNWQITKRTHVPSMIASTSEFASICPSSAVCMMKKPE